MSEENGRAPPASDPQPPSPQGPGLFDTGAEHVVVPVRIEEALGAAAMALICLISFGNVVVRYATNISFAFTEEYSVFLLVFMTFVGASAAFASNEHIRITFFLERMSPGLRARERDRDAARHHAHVLAHRLLRRAGHLR